MNKFIILFLFIVIGFSLISGGEFTVRVLETDYDNDQYGSYLQGCEYKVEFITSGDSISPPFSFSIPDLISINSNISIAGVDNTFYNELSFQILYGKKGSANIVVAGNNILLIDYDCQEMPYPITLLGVTRNQVYKQNPSNRIYSTVLKLDLQRPCNMGSAIAATEQPFECAALNEMSYDGLVLVGCKLNDFSYSGVLTNITIEIKDPLSRTTYLTFNSFILNSDDTTGIRYIPYDDPREPSIVTATKKEYYSRVTTTGPLGNMFTLNDKLITEPNIRVIYGSPSSRIVLISNFYYQTDPSNNILSCVSFKNQILRNAPLHNYTIGQISLPTTTFQYFGGGGVDTEFLALSLNINNYNPNRLNYQIAFKDITLQKPLSYPFNMIYYNTTGKTVMLYMDNYYTQGDLFLNRASFYQYTSAAWTDSQPPKLISIQYFPLKYAKMLIRVTATDDVSGVYMIVINSEFTLNSWDISDGNANNGTYEIIVDYSASVQIPKQTVDLYDFAGNHGNSSQFPVNEIPLYPKFPLTTTPMKYYQNITAIRFSFNDINLSVVGAQLQFFVNFLNVDKEFNVYLMILDPVGTINNNYWIVGQWSESDKMYKINIDLPSRLFTGVINYQLKYKGLIYTTNELRLTGLDYELRVISDFADQMPPIIEEIVKSPSQATIALPDSPNVAITWTLRITDPYNGFKEGLVKVTSSIDILEYEFTFNTTTPLISIPIKVCAAQDFKITYIKLTDNNGFYSIYDAYEYYDGYNNDNINPFVENLTSIYNGDLMISTTCATPSTDLQPPFVQLTTPTNPLNTGNPNRNVIFYFKVQDTSSNISPRHIPYCTLTTALFRELKVKAQEIIYSDKIAEYKCSYALPFGFGDVSNLAHLLISGVYDTNLNLGAYYGTSSVLSLSFNRDKPVIESVDRITSDGQLTIYGKNFQIPPSAEVTVAISYIDGSPLDIIFNVDFHSNIMLIVTPNGGVPIEKQFQVYVNIIISTISRSSDAFDGLPYIPPRKVTDPPQSLCKGTPLCGGPSNGNCSTDGCVCISPWYGIDCLSQTIKIDPPTINTTNPNIIVNVTLPDGENVSLSSLITLVSLDEIDNSNQIINSHLFTTWDYTNTTGENIDYQEHTYSTKITNNDVNTLVKVRLQYFIVGKTIYFANQELSILPSTLKYNIEMSSYPFSNSLNHLQLVLSASLESSNSDGCSIQESGEILNSDYLKLQINSNSLYGRFIKRGVIDNRIQIISNTITNNSTQTSSTTTRNIGINIPWYKSNVLLDPDFSLLVDTESAKSKDQSICNNSNDESGLTKSQLIGIIVSCICFGLVLIIIGVVILYKKSILFKVGVNKVIKLGKMDQ